MKTEVYSWRLSADKKLRLETEAKREGKSISQVLDEISSRWLTERRTLLEVNEPEQHRLRKRLMKLGGSLSGGNPDRASNASARVKEILAERYGRRTR